MPLIRRPRSLWKALRDVAIAPPMFLLVGVLAGLPWVLLSLVLVACLWLAAEPLGDLAPWGEVVFGIGGVAAIVTVAAIPLAMRDYFSGGGCETVWMRSPACEDAARGYAELLIAGDGHRVYDRFAPSLRAELPRSLLEHSIRVLHAHWGPPIGIDRLEERPLDSPHHVAAAQRAGFDAQVNVVLVHESGRHSTLTLSLNCGDAFQIVEWEYFTEL
jgi:hypothetical protein